MHHRLLMQRFQNRRDAGRVLAGALAPYAALPAPLVVALPRGGVPVGYEIARRLNAPLDVLVVRKIGVPRHPEVAMGAIASGGIRVIDRRVMDAVGASQNDFDAIARQEQVELDRREHTFREAGERLDMTGMDVILVDDGLATGSSMLAAIDVVRCKQPHRLIVAVPVASPETCAAIRDRVDEIVCLVRPEPFHAVGLWYDDFTQTSDDEVRELLAAARSPSDPRERREPEMRHGR